MRRHLALVLVATLAACSASEDASAPTTTTAPAPPSPYTPLVPTTTTFPPRDEVAVQVYFYDSTAEATTTSGAAMSGLRLQLVAARHPTTTVPPTTTTTRPPDPLVVRLGSLPLRGVTRRVPADRVVIAAVAEVMAGPRPDESDAGLRLERSGATGVLGIKVDGRIARVRLAGGCSPGTAPVTVADLLIATLSRLDGIDAVKIEDASGSTETPDGQVSSIPSCLRPDATA